MRQSAEIGLRRAGDHERLHPGRLGRREHLHQRRCGRRAHRLSREARDRPPVIDGLEVGRPVVRREATLLVDHPEQEWIS